MPTEPPSRMATTDQLVATVWRHRLTFLVTFICVLGAVAVVTYTLPKAYSTSAYVIVNTTQPTTSNYDAQQVSQVDTQSTAELLQSRNTANDVAAQLPFPATGKQVQGQVGISPVANTLLILITATDNSPRRAQELANTYARVSEQATAPTNGFARVSLGEPAPLITDPSSPRTHLLLLIGAILAAMAGVGAAVLRDRLDKTVRIADFETEAFGLPILARVPEVRMRRGRLRRIEPESTQVIEGLRWVFAHLAFVNGGERPRSIAVVSAGEQEGKSTMCVALGYAAEDRLTGKVLLVDADLRRPNLARLLDSDGVGTEGLSSYLAGPEDGAFPSIVLGKADSRLAVIPAGPVPPNPTSLLGLPRFAQFARVTKHECECVVFDTPPIRAGADATLVAAATDGAILVVDTRSSGAPSVRWSIDQLRRAHVNVLGVILNRVGGGGDLAYYDYGADRGRGRGRTRDGRPDEIAVAPAPAVDGAGDSPATTVAND